MLEVRKNHDCTKPSMVVGTEPVEYPDGRWWKRKRVQGLRNIYDTRVARFTCDVCGARWSWHNSFVAGRGGVWRCDWRPDTWEKVSQ